MPISATLWESLKAFQVYGANTNVGKTIVSSLLCQSLGKSNEVLYIKPVSTGDLKDADDQHLTRFNKSIQTQCLYQYKDPVSPHLAANANDFKPPSDNAVLTELFNALQKFAKASTNGWVITETAGGVLSPAPSKTSQADLYRPLRLPVILVADSRLGGISSTISSYESLRMRGYDIEALVSFKDEYYQNYKYFEEYFEGKVGHVASIDAPPDLNADSKTDFQNLQSYYSGVSGSSSIISLLNHLESSHQSRLSSLKSMASRADKTIWFPFSQHKNIPEESITTIDSAYGDFFQTLDKQDRPKDTPLLQPSFDGSASWWTQGLGHGNPQLSLAAAYAAGRYGHVILAGTVNDPAISLAENIISEVGNSRISRVFYSDNGSTGIEVAIKMALKSACDRYGWDISEKNIGVLGLKRSYHGDTIGSMDCTEPSVYNNKISWYKDRGYWFEYPYVMLKNGRWSVVVPEELKQVVGDDKTFESFNDIYNIGKRDGGKYKEYIKTVITDLLARGHKFGAVIFEPVLLGAGGMVAV